MNHDRFFFSFVLTKGHLLSTSFFFKSLTTYNVTVITYYFLLYSLRSIFSTFKCMPVQRKKLFFIIKYSSCKKSHLPTRTVSLNIILSYFLQCHDFSIFIPKIMPVFCSMPQEHLSFYKAVSFFECCNLRHLFFCQRIFCHCF